MEVSILGFVNQGNKCCKFVFVEPNYLLSPFNLRLKRVSRFLIPCKEFLSGNNVHFPPEIKSQEHPFIACYHVMSAATKYLKVVCGVAGMSGIEAEEEGGDDNLMEEEVDKSLHLKVTCFCLICSNHRWSELTNQLHNRSTKLMALTNVLGLKRKPLFSISRNTKISENSLTFREISFLNLALVKTLA
jgi:hypothetical protein